MAAIYSMWVNGLQRQKASVSRGSCPVTVGVTVLVGRFGILAFSLSRDPETHRVFWRAIYSICLRVRCDRKGRAEGERSL